jgi:CRISPR/Cas system CSM-associated protein Csm4 (group 5 of RAMP superfamily)
MVLTFTEIKENALKKATLVEALSYASCCDTERAVKQAINNHVNNTVANIDTGAKWETCSDFMFREITKAWEA